MAAHDVMEVTMMPRAVSPDGEGLEAVGTLDALDVDAAFAELVLADDELVALEFDALVAAEFGEPPTSGRVPHDQAGDGPTQPEPCDALAPRSCTPPAIPPARRRNRQRGPPRALPVLS
jgi:hypothetical protein